MFLIFLHFKSIMYVICRIVTSHSQQQIHLKGLKYKRNKTMFEKKDSETQLPQSICPFFLGMSFEICVLTFFFFFFWGGERSFEILKKKNINCFWGGGSPDTNLFGRRQKNGSPILGVTCNLEIVCPDLPQPNKKK